MPDVAAPTRALQAGTRAGSMRQTPPISGNPCQGVEDRAPASHVLTPAPQ
jgi:hypothetical protein